VRRRRFRLLDVVVEVSWRDDDLGAVATALFADAPSTADAPHLSIHLDGQHGNRWSDEARGGRRRAPLFQAVERQITEEVLRRGRASWWLLHAGAVAIGDRAWLVVGEPDAGKTSLTCALARAGGAPFSDEVAPVSPADLRVHPFPRDLILHEGTRRGLPGLPPSPGFACFDGYRYLPPSLVGGAATGGPVAAGGLLFPCRQAGSGPRVTPVGAAEAARKLLEQCFDMQGVGGERAVDCAARLAALPAARVDFDLAADAVPAIAGWWQRGAGTRAQTASEIEAAVVR
jgi:hypothetical protein